MGKVHGSLARAGKVKSQTPKVEKAEKPKTPKGRALKRIKYNRRFVNVTNIVGGKRRYVAICLVVMVGGGRAVRGVVYKIALSALMRVPSTTLYCSYPPPRHTSDSCE